MIESMLRRTALIASLAAAHLIANAGTAAAQTYPTRPITIVVPFAAGGGNDILARLIAQHMGRALGQQLVIENRAGAGGTLGARTVAKAAPDGYTLLVVTDTLTSNASTFRDPGYDPVTSFSPVTMLARAPGALAVKRDLGVATMDEFVALARRKGRDLTVASTGTGTVSHLTGIMFQQRMGLPAWTDIPYSGSAKAVTDLLGGHVDAMFSMVVPLVPHVAHGDIKLIAVTTKARSPAVPAAPTVAETTTLHDFDVVNWTALLAPAGTPRPIVEKLAAETAAALHDPTFLKRLETLGVEPAGDGPEALAQEIRRTVTQWRDVVRQSGLRVN